MNGPLAPRSFDAMGILGVAILVVALGGCREPRSGAEVRGTYDADGKLRLLTYDTNGNGKPDTWAYMDGTRIVRVEIDQNEDGVIERREDYDTTQALEKVELSTRSDGKITRTEFYDGGVLVRAEQDADGNGAVDRWETYADGQVRSVAFDLEGAGRPTLRLVYGSDGQLVRLETGPRPRAAHGEAVSAAPMAADRREHAVAILRVRWSPDGSWLWRWSPRVSAALGQACALPRSQRRPAARFPVRSNRRSRRRSRFRGPSSAAMGPLLPAMCG